MRTFAFVRSHDVTFYGRVFETSWERAVDASLEGAQPRYNIAKRIQDQRLANSCFITEDNFLDVGPPYYRYPGSVGFPCEDSVVRSYNGDDSREWCTRPRWSSLIASLNTPTHPPRWFTRWHERVYSSRMRRWLGLGSDAIGHPRSEIPGK